MRAAKLIRTFLAKNKGLCRPHGPRSRPTACVIDASKPLLLVIVSVTITC